MALFDESALERRMRAIAREEAPRPEFVHQRNVERWTGMPGHDLLECARARAFDSHKIKRLVYVKTLDVLSFIEAHRPATHAADDESVELSRVGARRVA
jgi:hypothetical protein